MQYEQWVKSEVNLSGLSNHVECLVVDALHNGYVENGTVEVYVRDMVSGHAGTHQAEYLCEMFGLSYTGEWDWLEIDKFADGVAEILTVSVGEFDLQGQFYFGHLEGDGSFGLFYVQEIVGDDHE